MEWKLKDVLSLGFVITWIAIILYIIFVDIDNYKPIHYYIRGYNDCQNNIVDKINKYGDLKNADSINILVNNQFFYDSLLFQKDLKIK